MALTKVTGSVIKDSVSLSGNVSVGGTLTYQDVTNVDALGIGTFRTGIKVLAGQVDVGSNIKLGNAGVITATSFVGSGANLTGIDATAIKHTDGNVKAQAIATGVNVTGNLEATGSLDLTDSGRLLLGTGDDLQIYHSGSGNFVDVHTNNLQFRTSGTTELMAEFKLNNAVDLYYDGTKRFETKINGAQVNGSTLFIRGGSGEDSVLQFIANNSASYNDHYNFRVAASGAFSLQTEVNANQYENMITATQNGNVELYHNNIKTFETTSEGATFDTGSSSCVVRLTSNTDAVTVLQGFNSDLYIKAPSGGNLVLYANGNEDAIKCIPNGAVELYDNGNKQCQTFDGGMNWQDDKKAEFGASGDLKLYHNGTDSYISNGTNNLRIGNTHNNNIKFFTQGSTRWNIDGSGHIIPDANNTFDIGSSSYRVRNIYTADLHCSNKGSSNDVDGTWGDYTIQEGESDLFLINNRNGKKYKFNLTEVS